MKTKKIAVSLVALAVFCAIIYLVSGSGQWKHPFRTLEPGKALDYSFTLLNNTGVVLFKPNDPVKPAGNISSKADFSGSLTVRCHKKDKMESLIGIVFRKMDKHVITYGSKEILPDETSYKRLIEGKEVRFVIDDLGAISSISFARKDHVLFRNIAKQLIGEIQLSLHKGDLWNVSERTLNGTVVTKYQRSESSKDKISRSREKYLDIPAISMHSKDLSSLRQKIESDAVFTRDGDDALDELNGKEKLSVTDTNGLVLFSLSSAVSLKKKGETSFGSDLSGLLRVTERIDEVVVTEKAQESLDRQQAKGMTEKELFHTLRLYSRTGKIHNKSKFIWRTAGFLKLNPKQCEKLATLFSESTIDRDGRMLIIGLLTTAGTPQAQRSLLNILKSDTALNDNVYPIMYQHLTLLENPIKEVVDKVKGTYNDALEDEKFVRESALTLGAVAHNLRKSGDKQAADEINSDLVDNLSSAGSDPDKAAHLDSLGNVGWQENLETIIPYTSSQNSPNVRASAVNAMRKNDTEKTRKTVHELTGDKEPLVQKQAIQTISRYSMEKEDLALIAEKITKGLIRKEFYPDVLNLLGGYLKEHPSGVKEVLDSMVASGTKNSHVTQRIRTMYDIIAKGE